MARRRSSSSGSGGGCLGVIILLVIIGFIMEAWPYLLLIAGCILGIWLLVKLFQHLNAQGNGTVTRVNTNTRSNAASNSNSGSKSVVNTNYSADADTCHEVDRQIKEMLVRRRELLKQISSAKSNITKHSMFWMKNDEKHIRAREQYESELSVLKGRYNAAVYAFREPVTQEFSRLKEAFKALGMARTKTYDSTPPSGQILIQYEPVGDMRYINFSTEPLCISLGYDIFCVIPYYIVHFKKSGAYVSTYSCKALKGGVANGSYNEQIKHVTWAHTRVDGMPDRRYSYNPQRVYYTTRTNTVWNMLALGIVNYQLKYEVDDSVKNGLIAAIKAFSALLPIKSYDPVHHLIRLLDECDKGNPNIEKLEMIIDGGTGVGNAKQALNRTSEQTIHRKVVNIQEKSSFPSASDSRWGIMNILKTIIGIGGGGVAAVFSLMLFIFMIASLTSVEASIILMALGFAGFAGIAAFLLIRMAVRIIKNSNVTNPNSKVKIVLIILSVVFAVSLVAGLAIPSNSGIKTSLDEQTIEQITTKWQSDGIVDYTDVSEFEKAVNQGVDLVGKTVTFTVVEVRPDSALGFDLWGGEHLNFVSDDDPGIKEGEEITVIVTGVKRVVTDSFKITYILLEK